VINAINSAVMLDMDFAVAAFQGVKADNGGNVVTDRAVKLQSAAQATVTWTEARRPQSATGSPAYADWIDQFNQRIRCGHQDEVLHFA
jgi:hypothetical protein